MNFRSMAKDAAASILYQSRIFDLLRVSLRRGRAVVLMYHRVLPSAVLASDLIQPGMVVSRDTFQRQAAYLKKKWTVLPLAELIARLQNGRGIDGCCAITFDDGWKDTFDHAFPVLGALNLPATVFLATGFVGTDRWFWPEVLAALLRKRPLDAADRADPVLAECFAEAGSKKMSGDFLETAIQCLRRRSAAERQEVLDRLAASRGNLPPVQRLSLNWAEAAQMKQSGLICFGAHTVNHEILDQLPLPQAEAEIAASRRDLEQHLGISPMLFAYPNGNWNPALQALVQKHGFAGAVTTRRGWVDAATDLLAMPRIGLHQDISRTPFRLAARIHMKYF